MTRVVRADAADAVAEATHALDAGDAIVIPTDTLYGLAADALSEEACLRVFEIKERPPTTPLPVLVGSVEEVRHVARLTPLARRLAAKHWPGAVTLVLPALGTVPDAVTASGPTVAVRVVDQPFARALALHFGPITATSANLHGRPPPATVEEARTQLGGRVPLLVDGGPLAGAPSTIVDATGDAPKVLREGAVPASAI